MIGVLRQLFGAHFSAMMDLYSYVVLIAQVVFVGISVPDIRRIAEIIQKKRDAHFFRRNSAAIT